MSLEINNSLVDVIERVKDAQSVYASFSQEQVDRIFRAASIAAFDASLELAELAVEETKLGVVKDKVTKNQFASLYVYNEYKTLKTCDIIERNTEESYLTVAEPMGVLCGIIPTTNPTSTAIFKSLLSLKTRNGIIFSPHPRAAKSTCEAAKKVLDAAVKAGAPKDIIAWLDQPSREDSLGLMRHEDISLILATGGADMVKSAYSSGKPAIGVGSGNVPCIIHESADLQKAVDSILESKTFDNGVVCASEQVIIVDAAVYDEVKQCFVDRQCKMLNPTEADDVRGVLSVDGRLNSNIVGQSAEIIAGLAGVSVPPSTKVLIGEVESGLGDQDVFMKEKLSPVLGLVKAVDFHHAVDLAVQTLNMGGVGHTASLFIDDENFSDDMVHFSKAIKAVRIVINTPSSQGAIGGLYNSTIPPSLTLGCGSWGGNSVSENVGPKHLINIKTVAAPSKTKIEKPCFSLA